MRISLIVAKSLNNVIGINNELPWKLSGDLKLFKKITMGHSLIMGRKTFESIGVVLPGRKSFVLTRGTENKNTENLFFFQSFSAIEEKLKELGETEVFIIGGAQIYKEFFDKAERIIMTDVHVTLDGDAYFPQFDLKQWKCIELIDAPEDAKNQHAWTRKIFVKKDNE